MIPVIIIGNPGNRRVADFVATLRAMNQPKPVVLAHRDLFDSLDRLMDVPASPHWVRIDSLGEDAEVERRLLHLGYSGAPTDHRPDALAARPVRFGEVLAPRQQYIGLCRYLDRLDHVFASRPEWRILNPPPAIKRLFDKSAGWRAHRAAGLPVPDALTPTITTPEALRRAMDARQWTSVYVKLNSGSSASGLAVFTRHAAREQSQQARERLMTTMMWADDGWFNSRRVRRLTGPAIDRVLAYLLAEGAHIEVSLPKARLSKAMFDLRVLVIGEQPAFTVVRQSHHPITNLHLGGWRGDVEALRRAMPAHLIDALEQTCRTAARLHGCFHLGLDVLLTPGLREHYIIEANAFGDLLPRLQLDGHSVYGHQIRTLASRA